MPGSWGAVLAVRRKPKVPAKWAGALGVCGELEHLWQEKGVKSHQGPDLCPFEDSAHGLNGHRFWVM